MSEKDDLGWNAIWKEGNKFDLWIKWLESSVGGPKKTVADLRKDTKSEKDQIWEQFCAR